MYLCIHKSGRKKAGDDCCLKMWINEADSWNVGTYTPSLSHISLTKNIESWVHTLARSYLVEEKIFLWIRKVKAERDLCCDKTSGEKNCQWRETAVSKCEKRQFWVLFWFNNMQVSFSQWYNHIGWLSINQVLFLIFWVCSKSENGIVLVGGNDCADNNTSNSIELWWKKKRSDWD